MDESMLDKRLEAFEKRQKLFISQRLEYHSNATNKKIESLDTKIDDVGDELKEDISGVRAASETAHQEIIARLERIESRLD